MPTTIKLRNSVTTTSAPSSLVQGEVAINITDKKVWVGNAATTPIQLLGDGGSGSFTSIAFGAGTVSSPSITFTGDTNTGIYSPAADTIAFTEGGVESMRIDSSGNVGINTTTTFAKLSVEQTGGNTVLARFNSSNARAGLYIGGTSGAPFFGYNLTHSSGNTFNFDTTGFAWWIGNPDGAAQLSIGSVTGTAGNAANTAATNASISITTSGNVGIGTSSPASKLDVTSGTNNSLQARFGNVAGRGLEISTALVLGTNDAGSVFNAKGATSGTMIFQTDSTERMRIDSSGNVGIGTSSPAQLLQVAQGTKATTASAISSAGFTTTDAAGSTFGLYFRQKTDATASNRWTGIQSFDNGVGASNLVLQDLGGNVGIGTSSPTDALLHLNGGTSTNIKFTNSATGTTSSDGFFVGLSISSDPIAYIFQREAQAMVFGTSNTERMRITSGGDVCVGTTAKTGVSTNNAWVTGGVFSTYNGTFSGAGSGTTVTLTSIPNTNAATYLVSASIAGPDTPSSYTCVAIVRTSSNGTNPNITNLATATLATMSLSGSNLQFVQNSGVTQNLQWSLLRIM